VGRAAVTVRGAQPGDLTSLLVLVTRARDDDPDHQRTDHRADHQRTGLPSRSGFVVDRSRLEALLRRADVQVLLAHDRPGAEPVGVLVLRRGELLPLTGHEAVHVEQLWVHPEHRRRGVARALLRQAAATAEQSGLDEVVCTLPPSWREAHRFLARLGFAPLTAQRAVSVPNLLRRLGSDAGTRRRTGLEQVLARRRRELRHGRRSDALV
jgi:ribosomal protein S18 acetylase RimI-like enzyme